MQMQGGRTADPVQVEQELEEMGGLSLWDKIFLYGFFGLVGLGLISIPSSRPTFCRATSRA